MLNQAIRKLDRRDPLRKSKNKDRNLNLPIKKKIPQLLLQSSWCFTRNEGKHIVNNKIKAINSFATSKKLLIQIG